MLDPAWGTPPGDERGSLLADLLASFGMTALNLGGEYTFERDGRGSIIDITAVRRPARPRFGMAGAEGRGVSQPSPLYQF